MVLGVGVFFPTNFLRYLLQDIDFYDLPNMSADLFRISNVQDGSNKLWLHFSAVYAVYQLLNEKPHSTPSFPALSYEFASIDVIDVLGTVSKGHSCCLLLVLIACSCPSWLKICCCKYTDQEKRREVKEGQRDIMAFSPVQCRSYAKFNSSRRTSISHE